MAASRYPKSDDPDALVVRTILLSGRQWDWLRQHKGGATKMLRSLIRFAMRDFHELTVKDKRIKELEYQVTILTEALSARSGNSRKVPLKRGRRQKGYENQPVFNVISIPSANAGKGEPEKK